MDESLESVGTGVRFDAECSDDLKRSLCYSCENGLVYRRLGHQDLVAHCRELSGRIVPPDLAECSNYDNRRGLTIHEMKELVKEHGTVIDKRIGIHDKSYT